MIAVTRTDNCSTSGGTAYGNSYFGGGSGGIFLDNVYCTGGESRLTDCYHSGIGVHNCDHTEDAGVRCTGIIIIIVLLLGLLVIP